MPSKLSLHWMPTHDQTPYIAMQRAIAAPTPKLVSSSRADPQHFSDLYQSNPRAKVFILRDHAMSEQKRDIADGGRAIDPAGTGRRHAQEWARQLDDLYSESKRRGLPVPERSRVAVEGINEPPIWEAPGPAPWAEYEIARLDEQTRLGIPGVYCNFSVGWPGNGGIPDAPPNWSDWIDLLRRLADGRAGHLLGLHEYFGRQGPAFMAGWLAYRYRHLPIKPPTVITELGAVKTTTNERGDPVQDAYHGWQGLYSSPAEYMAHLIEYDRETQRDPYIVGSCVFTADGGHPWIDHGRSFDVLPLAPAWAAYATESANQPPPAPAKNYMPIVSGPGSPPPAPPEEPQPPPPVLYRPYIGNHAITQPYGANPHWYTPLAGHPGIDYGTPPGTPILAPAPGTVIEVDHWPESWGKYIKVAAPWGEYLLAHLSQIHVSPGQTVIPGQPIGTSGNTGRVIRADGTPGPAPDQTYGAHLHFGIRLRPITRGGPMDGWSDPAPYLEPRPAEIPPAPPAPTLESLQAEIRHLSARQDAIEAALWPERIRHV